MLAEALMIFKPGHAEVNYIIGECLPVLTWIPDLTQLGEGAPDVKVLGDILVLFPDDQS
jgi:hypothetical protein